MLSADSIATTLKGIPKILTGIRVEYGKNDFRRTDETSLEQARYDQMIGLPLWITHRPKEIPYRDTF